LDSYEHAAGGAHLMREVDPVGPLPDADASSRGKPARASARFRPLDMLVRPQPLPLGIGAAVAASLIGLESLVVYWLQHMGSDQSFRAVFLLGVMVISAGCEFPLALATSVASGLVYFYFHLDHNGPIVADDFIALLVFLPLALVANLVGRQARMHGVEAEKRREEADNAASFARMLAQQQAALRRVATLVARGVPPAQIYPAAVAELSRG
jgi:K+-sensing histidine kinase KdpD